MADESLVERILPKDDFTKGFMLIVSFAAILLIVITVSVAAYQIIELVKYGPPQKPQAYTIMEKR